MVAAAATSCIPTQDMLRVQGVGDLVEGAVFLQSQHQQQRGGTSWSLHKLDDWRARAFATDTGLVQQQQRDLRRLLLQNSTALSPIKKKTGGGGGGGSEA